MDKINSIYLIRAVVPVIIVISTTGVSIECNFDTFYPGQKELQHCIYQRIVLRLSIVDTKECNSGP